MNLKIEKKNEWLVILAIQTQIDELTREYERCQNDKERKAYIEQIGILTLTKNQWYIDEARAILDKKKE